MGAEAEDYGGVGAVVVVVFELDFDAGVVGKVGPFEGVDGEGGFGAGDEEVGLVHDPVGIDAHVIGDHVGGEAEAYLGGAVAEILVGFFAAEVLGYGVGLERVGAGYGVGVAAEALDGLGGSAALPKADEPEAGDAAVGEGLELLGGDLVEAVDVALVLLRELLEPDVGGFCDEDDVGHPGVVGGEGFVLVERGLVVGGIAAAAGAVGGGFVVEVVVETDVLVAYEPVGVAAVALEPGGAGVGGMVAEPEGDFFFADGGEGEESAAEGGGGELFAEDGGPVLADEVELGGDAGGVGEDGGEEGVEEGAELGEWGAGFEVGGEGGGYGGVGGFAGGLRRRRGV